MILSYRAGRYASLDTLKSKIRPLLPILYGGNKNVTDGLTESQTHRLTDTHTEKMKISNTLRTLVVARRAVQSNIYRPS